MRAIKTLFTVIAFTALCGCAKPEYGDLEHKADFLHDDCTIHSIYCYPANAPVITQIAGKIDNEAGTIVFEIPNDKNRKYYDVTALKIKANIGYDAIITPSMSSDIWDLSEGREFTVTATMTGNSRKYIIEAYFIK